MLGMSVSPGEDVPDSVGLDEGIGNTHSTTLGEETGDVHVHVLRLGKVSGSSVETDDAVVGPGDGTGNVQVQGSLGSSDDSEGRVDGLGRFIGETECLSEKAW